MKLHNYQQDAVDNIRKSYAYKHNAPLFVLATGGGKTYTFCYIADQASQKNKNVWILVHRVELLRQTSKSLSNLGVEHGLINAKYTPNPMANVQVASVGTLVNRLHKLKAPDIIIIDEAHHALAGSWRKVIDYFPKAKILGVTATPIRGDGKGLDTVFDDIIIGPQIYELIEMGFLTQPKVYAPPVKIDFSAVKIVRGDYDKKEVTEIMDRPTITGNAVAHYKKLCPGVPCVVFCVSIDHAEHVAEDFRNAGFKAYSVDGTMDDDQRSRILNGLGDGTVEVVTSCDLISEGTDIPAIECGIMLRPTQSLGLYIQQAGRILRIMEGKKYAYLLDHVGNTLNHGLITDHRDWTLEGRKINKKTISEKDIRVQQCESCYHVFEPQPICPACGHQSKTEYKSPKEIEGELIEIQKKDEQTKKEIKIEKKREVNQARTMPELLVIQKERGYKNGWARMKFLSRPENKM